MIPIKNITDSGNYSDTMVLSPIHDLFNTKKSKGIVLNKFLICTSNKILNSLYKAALE